MQSNYYRRPNRSQVKNVEFYKRKIKQLEEENIKLKQQISEVKARDAKVTQVIKQKNISIKQLKISNKKLKSQIKYIKAKHIEKPEVVGYFTGKLHNKGISSSLNNILNVLESRGTGIEGTTWKDILDLYIEKYGTMQVVRDWQEVYYKYAYGYGDGSSDRGEETVYVTDENQAVALGNEWKGVYLWLTKQSDSPVLQ